MPAVNAAGDDEAVLLAFAPLSKSGFGVASGTVLGAGIFLATLILLFRGAVNSDFALLSQFFWGYSISFGGAFVGLAWGFIFGFLLGWLLALLRNMAFWVWLALARSRAEREEYSDFLDHM